MFSSFPSGFHVFFFFFFFRVPSIFWHLQCGCPSGRLWWRLGSPTSPFPHMTNAVKGPKGQELVGGGIRRQHWGPTRCHQHSSLSVKAATTWGSGHVRSPFRTEILGRTDSEVFGRLLQTECASLTFICWNPNPHSDGIRRWKPLGGD